MFMEVNIHFCKQRKGVVVASEPKRAPEHGEDARFYCQTFQFIFSHSPKS